VSYHDNLITRDKWSSFFAAASMTNEKSFITLTVGGIKYQARNDSADSLIACAAKCNAAFLANAK
jgi:hypothetical protein